MSFARPAESEPEAPAPAPENDRDAALGAYVHQLAARMGQPVSAEELPGLLLQNLHAQVLLSARLVEIGRGILEQVNEANDRLSELCELQEDGDSE